MARGGGGQPNAGEGGGEQGRGARGQCGDSICVHRGGRGLPNQLSMAVLPGGRETTMRRSDTRSSVVSENQTNTSTNQLRHLPTQGSSNHVRIHAAHNHEHDYYNTLYSTKVVHIPHES
jgi:hypothetical protein